MPSLSCRKQIQRLFQPEIPHVPGIFFFAMAGIGTNSIAALTLPGRRSLNIRVALWHLIEDVLGWVAVLVITIVLLLADFPVLDPVLSILITAYVLFNVFRQVCQTFLLFLQAVPKEIVLAELRRRLDTLTHVRSNHHTHVSARKSLSCARNTALLTQLSRSSGAKTNAGWPSLFLVSERCHQRRICR